MTERRRNPRVEVDVPVELAAGEARLTGRVRDVSVDAVLVEAESDWPLGTDVTLGLTLPGDAEALHLAGQVIRLGDGEGGRRAMALLFSDLPPAAATRIDLFLHRQGHA